MGILIGSKALGSPPLGQTLNKVDILTSFVKPPVGIAAVVGKLILEI